MGRRVRRLGKSAGSPDGLAVVPGRSRMGGGNGHVGDGDHVRGKHHQPAEACSWLPETRRRGTRSPHPACLAPRAHRGHERGDGIGVQGEEKRDTLAHVRRNIAQGQGLRAVIRICSAGIHSRKSIRSGIPLRRYPVMGQEFPAGSRGLSSGGIRWMFSPRRRNESGFPSASV